MSSTDWSRRSRRLASSGPTEATRDLLLDGLEMARPGVHRQRKEVATRLRLIGKKVSQWTPAFSRVAALASGHYVARRPVAAAHLRLDMVDAQIVRFLHFAAVDAAVVVAGKDF
jgi:hypothetical protein